jgi:hypothetical protein
MPTKPPAFAAIERFAPVSGRWRRIASRTMGARTRRSSADEQEGAERERVRGDDPLEVAARRADVLLDRGQRDGDDHLVEHDEQVGRAEHGERAGWPWRGRARDGGRRISARQGAASAARARCGARLRSSAACSPGAASAASNAASCAAARAAG